MALFSQAASPWEVVSAKVTIIHYLWLENGIWQYLYLSYNDSSLFDWEVIHDLLNCKRNTHTSPQIAMITLAACCII